MDRKSIHVLGLLLFAPADAYSALSPRPALNRYPQLQQARFAVDLSEASAADRPDGPREKFPFAASWITPAVALVATAACSGAIRNGAVAAFRGYETLVLRWPVGIKAATSGVAYVLGDALAQASHTAATPEESKPPTHMPAS